MIKQFGWGLLLATAITLTAGGCDRDRPADSSDDEPSQAPVPTGHVEGGPGMYSGEALLERSELARRDIRGMLDRSRDYWERFEAFPDSAPLTPSALPCGPAGNPLNESDWRQPTWESLRFVPRDPHHYSYQYDSSGSGTGARFVVTAIAQLDCDGPRTGLQRGATVQADGIIASDREVTEFTLND